MATTYLGAVAKGTGDYSIVFLDLPGCASCGETLDEVLRMGHEALQGHIDVMRDYGDLVPLPSAHTLHDVERWLYDPEDEERDPWVGLFPIVVEDDDEHGDVRVALPRGLIRDLDATLPDARSFIIDATRRELDRLKKSA